MKKLVVLLLAVIMMLGLVACAPAESNKTTITVWATPLCGDFETYFNDIVLPEFQKTNPDVEVVLEMQTWEGIADKLQIALSTNSTPDVYVDGTARMAGLPSLNVLEPVDDVVGAYNDWYGTVSNIGVIDGKHYLVPASTIACSSLTVNVTLAKELGVYDMLPADGKSWTIQDFYKFVEAASLAGKDKGVYGTYLYAGSSTSDDILYSLMLSNGAQIIDKENMTCTANSAAGVEVIQVLGDIVKNGYCLPGAATMTAADSTTEFLNRKYVVALNVSASSATVNMQTMVDEGYLESCDEFMMLGIPTVAGKDMVSASWGANCFGVFTNDGNADKIAAAKALVKSFVGNNEMTGKMWAQTPTYTPVRDAGVAFETENEALKALVENHADWSGKYANSSFGILEPYWAEIRNLYYPELQAVYSGTKTAQQAMDSFVEKVNEVLKNYK